MTVEQPPQPSFRSEHFTQVDFTGAVFRDCDLRNVKVVDTWLTDVSVSGLVRNFFVNDVDVTTFVESELDTRHPERVQLRSVATPDDHRHMWDAIERCWATAYARAGQLPESALDRRVDDEWSFSETLRHLIFCTDAWISRPVLDEPLPYSPIGQMHSSHDPALTREIGIDRDARPNFGEVMRVRAERMAVVRAVVDGLNDDGLLRICERSPAPGYPEQSRTVKGCVGVVLQEEVEHYRYAMRDLAVLEAGI